MSYPIAVRSLCEFTAKAGDLDLRFTPSPTAQQGMQGHAAIARRRDSRYETEIVLESSYGELLVRGRADGYDASRNRLEEFKTYRGDLAHMPASHRTVHWAQLRIYGALFCRRKGLQTLQLGLVYFNIATEVETLLLEEHSAESLERHFASSCERFLAWARTELHHRQRRDSCLERLGFPFDAMHPRQRELAEDVYRTLARGRTLLAQAPTGIGKTLGTLFPALKAMPGQRLDKIFFLVAKTSGRGVVLQTLRQVEADKVSANVRVLELVAREKSCEHPAAQCHGESCPLARGFYDRLPAARETAAGILHWDREAVRAVGLQHAICPYYLSQELTRWADVIVADYNYYFDSSAMLYALTIENQWRVALLVDEAHNLVDRARAMYSASVDRAVLDAARQLAPAPLQSSIHKVQRHWEDLLGIPSVPYRMYEAVPPGLLRCLEESVSSLAEQAAGQPQPLAPPLLEFYFRAGKWCRLAADLEGDSICEVLQTPRAAATHSSSLCLRNVIPARHLASRWAAAHAKVLFSATLGPFQFYRDILGLPTDTRSLDVGSPFAPGQLSVRIVKSISTRFRERADSIAPISQLIAECYRAQPGNYLAFFSSFEYLRSVADRLAPLAPDIPLWCQESAMSEAQRAQFLTRFEAGGRGIGFAVLGGAFGEGIDLPGSRLIGAFVATLGLPQLNAANETTRRCLEERFGTGYEYAYLYPGLRKVVQAAGRVIRAPADRGVVYLIDDRFARADVRRLLPGWWFEHEGVASGPTCTWKGKCGT